MGLVITSVVQSSSVTVSILVVMGDSGLMTLESCMFVILGCNIGACTSAMLACMGGSKNAKRIRWAVKSPWRTCCSTGSRWRWSIPS